jgi:hypothetical protein
MWFRAKNNSSKNRATSPPSRRRQRTADRNRESRRLLLESLEERRVLTFLPAVDYVVGDNPQALVSGDFNGDSQLDLVVANTGSDNVTLLLGNADGSFTSGGSFAVGDSPMSVAAGDFNSDGKLDLVTANSGSHDLSVLQGNGAGGFAAATSVPHNGARSVAVGDFNADGKLDLAVGERTSSYVPPWYYSGYYWGGGGGGYFVNYPAVSVLLGTGSGGFGNPSSYFTGSDYYSYITYGSPDQSLQPIAITDSNADGKADVVVGGSYNLFNILLGSGTGTLQPPRQLGIGSTTIAMADFNLDGKLDLASYGYGNFVQVALGDGLGGFANPANFEVGVSPSSVTAADVNFDGRPDLVVASSQTSEVKVLLGKSGAGLQFTPPITAATGVNSLAVLSKDFNGDGRLDLAAVESETDLVSVLLNDGTWLDTSAPALQIGNATVTEGNSGTINATFAITLSAAYNQPVSLHYATGDYPYNSATADVDYVAQSGQITIPAGQTSAVIEVPVIGDRVGEFTEYFVVNLSNPTNAFIADGQGVGTILDDEPVISMESTYVSTTEGNTGTTLLKFIVRLSAASSAEVRVNYSTVEGDTGWWSGGGYYGGYDYHSPATSGNDFQPVAGTLVFAPGEVEKSIDVPVIGDRVGGEGYEYFFLNLSDASGALLTYPSGVGAIVDDEPHAYIISYPNAPEGNAGTSPLAFTVVLSHAYDEPVTVSYTTSDGSALAGSDYVATTGSVTFEPFQTSQSIAVPIMGDTVPEYDEYFGLRLTGAENASYSDYSVYGYINDDDTPPTISIEDAWITEGNSGTRVMNFHVSLSNPWGQGVTVNFATLNGTAKTSDNDYVAKSGSLYFAPGETSQLIQIVIKGDTRKEQNETFQVRLSGASGATIEDGQATGTIFNDDFGGKGNGKGNVKGNVKLSSAAVDAALHELMLGREKSRRK